MERKVVTVEMWPLGGVGVTRFLFYTEGSNDVKRLFWQLGWALVAAAVVQSADN